MIRVLNVAEKPSAAKEIATHLSGGNFVKRAGQSKYNHVFEFDMQLGNATVRMCVTSVAGHLQELQFEQRFAKWQSCKPEALFRAPVFTTVSEASAPIARQLEIESRAAQRLILWLDCDREGEHIAHEVMDVCLGANRALDVKRARFSAFIQRELVHAVNTLVLPNRLAADAVAARIELDLRIGSAFTRYQTLQLRTFGGLEAKIVSYGPCQFPTLGFVVERYQRVASFVPEPFWYLSLTLRKNGESVQLNWQRNRLFDQDACLALFERAQRELGDGGAGAVVESMDTKPTSKLRPLPLTTVALQKLASRKLNLSAETTMQVAEKLYNGGYLSYPRTETDQFQQGFDLQNFVALQRGDPEWGAYAARLLDQPGQFVWPRAGKNDDHSHPPIHPTKPGVDLTNVERSLYEMVARHFLACCSDDARGRQTTLAVRVGADERFTVSGVMIDARNFLDVYKYETWSTRTLPTFVANERVLPEALEMLAGSTTPPSLLTEAELITLMDEHGIGTDATIAQHIATILRREYAVKNARNEFAPTSLGAALVDGYKRIGYDLDKPQMRAEMEADMQAIMLGGKTRAAVVAAWIDRYEGIYRAVTQRIDTLLGAFSVHFRPAVRKVESEQARFSSCSCGGHFALQKLEPIANQPSFGLKCDSCQKEALLKEQPSPTQHRCAHCNSQVVKYVYVSFDKQRSVHVCPQCFAAPPPALLAANWGGPLDCSHCMHASCTLARGHMETAVVSCPTKCGDSLRLYTADSKRVMLRCSNKACDYAAFLPADVTRGVTTTKDCAACATAKPKRSSKLVTLTSSDGTVTTCIAGCDPMLTSQLRVKTKTPAAATTTNTSITPAMPLNPLPPSNARPTTAKATATTSTTSTRKPATRGTKRAIATEAQPMPNAAALAAECYRCHQVGHFAAQCPTVAGAPSNMSTASNKDAPCFKCGQSGHWASNCTSAANAPPRFGAGAGFGAGGSAVGGTQCKCGGVLVERVTQKPGPNMGRAFLKCTSASCGVFEWK